MTPLHPAPPRKSSRPFHRPVPLAAILGASLGFLSSAQAQWIVTSGTGPFSYADSANWAGGVVNGQFTNTVFTGGASNNAVRVITFANDTTIPDLNFYPPNASAYGATAVRFESTGGTPRTLTLDGSIRMTAPDTINGSYLDIGSTTPANALNVVLGAASVIQVNGGTSNTGYLSFLNTVTGPGKLTKAGLGSLDFLGAATIAGPVNIDGGAIRVLGSGGALSSGTINIGDGSALMLLNSSTPMTGGGTAGASSSRIDDNAVINLMGGYANNLVSLSHVNRRAFGIVAPNFTTVYNTDFGNLVVEGASDATVVNEKVGSINLQSGLSRVNLRTSSTTTGNVTLSADSLTRTAGTVISFAGGYGAQINNNALFSTIGGGQGGNPSVGQTYVKFATAPSMTGGILPYAVVAPENFFGYGGGSLNELAAYDSTNGIVPYSRVGSYATDLNAAVSTDNLKLTAGANLNVSGTINSLSIVGGGYGTFNVSGSNTTLKLLSGTILRNYLGSGNQIVTLKSNLTLDFNNQEAFIYDSYGTLELNSPLTNIGAAGVNLVAAANGSGIGANAILWQTTVTPNVPIRVLAGTLRLNANVPNNVFTVASGGTIALPGNVSVGGLTGDGDIRLDGLTLKIGGASTNTGTVFSGNISGSELKDGVLGFAPYLINGGNIVKTGMESLTLSGANTYGGNTTVSQGTLIAGADAASTLLNGATRVGSITPGTVDTTAKTLTGNLANGSMIYFPDVGSSLAFGATSTTSYEGRANNTVVFYVVNSTGTTFQLAATPGGAPVAPTVAGATNYQQIAGLTADSTADTLTLPSGAGTLANGNIIYLSAINTTGVSYPSGLTGGVPYYVVNAATSGSTFQVSNTPGGSAIDITTTGTGGLFAMRPGAFGSGTNAIIIGDSGSGSASKALLTGGAFTIERNVVITGTATGGTGTATLGGNTDDDSTFSGAIALGATTQLASVTTGARAVTFSGVLSGSGGITKVGPGKVILSGSSGYGGTTTVSAGTLSIAPGGVIGDGLVAVNAGTLNVNGATGSGGLTVANGATLSGTGTIGGASVVSGNLRPGNSGVGVLTFNNSLTLAGTALIKINDTATRGTGFDGVNVLSGSTTFGGTLTLAFGNAGALSNGSLAIFNFAGTSLGNFASVTSTGFYSGTWTSALDDNLWSFSDGSQTLTFSELDGTLTVVPEPSGYWLLAGGMSCLVLLRRRRSGQCI